MMARAATPTRRPPSAVPAAAAAASSARDLLPRGRVRLPAAADARCVSAHPPHAPPAAPPRKRACACSPTTHPGSFRCALHRGQGAKGAGGRRSPTSSPPAPVSSRLSAARRPSMASPLVRIKAVEGADHVRRALAALVRPPPQHHQTSRRSSFRPRPSRLSAMSAAADEPSS
ncbi:hypothetical protein ACP70R_003398 [Stipagrostis hirtigluma subsp. patula]